MRQGRIYVYRRMNNEYEGVDDKTSIMRMLSQEISKAVSTRSKTHMMLLCVCYSVMRSSTRERDAMRIYVATQNMDAMIYIVLRLLTAFVALLSLTKEENIAI